MAKLRVNQRFPVRLSRNTFALIAVVDPQGRVKVLRVAPGNEKLTWVHPEWQRDGGGRVTGLISIDLTTEREAAGCLFLEQAYDAEKWPDGWKAYQSYIDSQYMFTYLDEKNVEQVGKRSRAVNMGHFPPEMLPLRVQQMMANAPVVAIGPKWKPPAGLTHPNKKAAAEIAKLAKDRSGEVEDAEPDPVSEAV